MLSRQCFGVIGGAFLAVLVSQASGQSVQHYGHFDSGGNYYGRSTYHPPIQPLRNQLRNLFSVGAEEGARDRRALSEQRQYEESLFARQRAEMESLRRLERQEAEASLLRQRMQMQQEEHELRMQLLRRQLREESSGAAYSDAVHPNASSVGLPSEEPVDAATQRAASRASPKALGVGAVEMYTEKPEVKGFRGLFEERKSHHLRRLGKQRPWSSDDGSAMSEIEQKPPKSQEALPKNFRFLPPAERRRLMRMRDQR